MPQRKPLDPYAMPYQQPQGMDGQPRQASPATGQQQQAGAPAQYQPPPPVPAVPQVPQLAANQSMFSLDDLLARLNGARNSNSGY